MENEKDLYVELLTQETERALNGLYWLPYVLNVDYDKTKINAEKHLKDNKNMQEITERGIRCILNITNLLITVRNTYKGTGAKPQLDDSQRNQIKSYWKDYYQCLNAGYIPIEFWLY